MDVCKDIVGVLVRGRTEFGPVFKTPGVSEKWTDAAMLARLLSSASSPTGRPSFTHRALIFVIGGAFLFLLFRWILAPDEKLLEKLKNKKVNMY